MSKSANPGELRTRVYFSRVERETNENYVEQETEVSVLTDEDDMPRPARCKWVNAHGSESWSDQALQLRNPATLTTRYNPALLDRSLIIYRYGDSEPYEVIDIDNVRQLNKWLEIKVVRKVNAR
jgi:hypothetical protein